jgi:cell division protein FtsB
VAGRARETTRARKSKIRRPHIGRRRLRLLWAVAIVGVAVYLYYRPIASYLETRNQLETSRAEVESLGLVKAELELRLVNSTSVDSIEREARRIGYVKPGERLFVVKGIPAWRKARSAARDDGP